MKHSLPKGVTHITANTPGPTIAILAGVHGDEPAGPLALPEIIEHINLIKGDIYFIIGNPAALEKNERFIETNLNRNFKKNNQGTSLEEKRAQELMPIMDRCDALIDLHGFRDKTGSPFSICDEASVEIARKLLPQIISTGWDSSEAGGSDSYLHEQGKPAITVECGPIGQAHQSGKLVALICVHQFLKHYKMIDTPIPFATDEKMVVEVQYAVTRTSEAFALREGMQNFQELAEGEVFGQQDGKPFAAKAGDVIIFPRPQQLIGHEAFSIGRKIE